MRRFGFSTGALARGNFRKALEMLGLKTIGAIELSALREHELQPLIDALESIDVSRFSYVSVHAPSKYDRSLEKEIAGKLQNVAKRGWPVVLHPDTIHDFAVWESFGGRLLIENMDKRYATGRTVAELATIFDRLPQAGLCFDVGHCKQVDPTMNESFAILREFGTRLGQIHLSEVNTQSAHAPLSDASIRAVERIAPFIPGRVPIILESPVSASEIDWEIARAALALPITTLQADRRSLVKPSSNPLSFARIK
jgi:hypothetical protein